MGNDSIPDHDHGAEDAFLAYVADPSPSAEYAAEWAIATLQRRYDALLRRLDGVDEPPETPDHPHNAWDDPAGCLDAVLHELAGAKLRDRAETLAHGLEAARAYGHYVREARAWAWSERHQHWATAWDTLTEDPEDADDVPAWLTSPVEPTRQGWWWLGPGRLS